MAEHDLSKLPKWVQDKIELLQRNVARLEAEIVQKNSGYPDSDTWINPYDKVERQGLKPREDVRFLLTPEKYSVETHRNWIDVRVRHEKYGGNYIEIMGEDSITVSPKAGNVVEIRLADRG